MKLLHLGDLHLGRSLGDYDLYEDQKFILGQILGIVEEKSVNGVLIAGDVYDKSIPSEAATSLLDWFFGALAAYGVETFVISGNHDSDERLNFGSRLFEAAGIHISSKYDGTLHRVTLEDEYGEVDVYMLPFVKASQVRRFFPDVTLQDYDAAVRRAVEAYPVDKTRRNVLVAHQFVVGGLHVGDGGAAKATGSGSGAGDGAKDADPVASAGGEDHVFTQEPQLAGSEGLGTFSVGLVEKVCSDCFDAFDYVALGHIHSPQQVGRETVRYSGSPLKYSLSEANNDKSVPIITFGDKGDCRIELVNLIPRRDVRHIKGPMEELVDNVTSADDYIYVTLTDENVRDDAMGVMRQYYPNVVKLDYDNSHTREIERFDFLEERADKSFLETVGEFYSDIYGCEMGGDEIELLCKAAGEAGLMDEAD